MVDRIITPLVAIGLAVLVWMYTRSRDQEAIDNVRVPVELQIAPSQADMFDLENSGPGEVAVSFVGPPSRIRQLRAMLHHGEIRVSRTISVPDERKDDNRYSEVLRIDASEIPVPPGVHVVVNETQNRVPITMIRLIEKQMKVDFRHTGGDRITLPSLEPGLVTVRGPKELLESRESHPTELYHAPAPTNSDQPSEATTALVPLTKEINGRSVRVSPAATSVKFTLNPDQRDHELTDVPIRFLTPENFPFRPKFQSDRDGLIKLKIRGPYNVAPLPRESVSAYVDLTKRTLQEGTQLEEPIQVQLPPGYRLIQVVPPRLDRFELVPVTKPMPITPMPGG